MKSTSGRAAEHLQVGLLQNALGLRNDVDVSRSDHLRQLEDAFNSDDRKGYKEAAEKYLKECFERIMPVVRFSGQDEIRQNPCGAFTFFSRFLTEKPSAVGPTTRSFLHWDDVVCPGGKVTSDSGQWISKINQGLRTWFCEKKQCPVPLECKRKGPDSDCLKEALGLFLQSLRYSASNLVDQILPRKISIVYEIPHEEGNGSTSNEDVLLEILDLWDRLGRNKEDDKTLDSRRIAAGCPIDEYGVSEVARCVTEAVWDQTFGSNRKNWQGMFFFEENREWLQAEEYSFRNFLELPISLLVISDARWFYFMHFGLGLAQQKDGNGAASEAGRAAETAPATGTLILYDTGTEPLSAIELAGLYLGCEAAMLSLSAHEYAFLLTQQTELEVAIRERKALTEAWAHAMGTELATLGVQAQILAAHLATGVQSAAIDRTIQLSVARGLRSLDGAEKESSDLRDRLGPLVTDYVNAILRDMNSPVRDPELGPYARHAFCEAFTLVTSKLQQPLKLLAENARVVSNRNLALLRLDEKERCRVLFTKNGQYAFGDTCLESLYKALASFFSRAIREGTSSTIYGKAISHYCPDPDLQKRMRKAWDIWHMKLLLAQDQNTALQGLLNWLEDQFVGLSGNPIRIRFPRPFPLLKYDGIAGGNFGYHVLVCGLEECFLNALKYSDFVDGKIEIELAISHEDCMLRSVVVRNTCTKRHWEDCREKAADNKGANFVEKVFTNVLGMRPLYKDGFVHFDQESERVIVGGVLDA